MISIILSERDFDYEIQALVSSFFPGIHVNGLMTIAPFVENPENQWSENYSD